MLSREPLFSEAQLDAWLDDLMLGRVELAQLPPAVSAIYSAGHAAGYNGRQAEVDQAEHNANIYYVLLYNDPKRLREIHELKLLTGNRPPWDPTPPASPGN